MNATQSNENAIADASELETYWEGIREIQAEQAREDAADAMREARGNDGVRPFMLDNPPGSLDSQDAKWAHWMLTGGE